jgi:AcrR family transcriptional regulator
MRLVSQAADPKQDRISRRQVDKFAERRSQLAASALLTLSELGYARTSLREIAQNSEFSHGVLHYYFRDKVDLITSCVRQYKAECVTRYDQVVVNAPTGPRLRTGFADTMTTTLHEDAAMHRLWYDLRNQSLFEDSFRADVREIDESLERMIWRIVSRYAELSGSAPAVPSRLAYALFDGVFQQALFSHLGGGTAGELRDNVGQVLDKVVA